jgi:hypothetical protein
MFAVAMNGDTPFAIVILQEQRTIHAGPRAPFISHSRAAQREASSGLRCPSAASKTVATTIVFIGAARF